MLIVCICFFASASCIFAANIDDGLSNDLGTVDDCVNGEEVNILDEMLDETADSAADVSDDYSTSNADDHKSHGSHFKKKDNFAHGDERPDHRDFKNFNGIKKANPNHKHQIKKHSNATHERPNHKHQIKKHSNATHDMNGRPVYKNHFDDNQMPSEIPQPKYVEMEAASPVGCHDAQRPGLDRTAIMIDVAKPSIKVAGHDSKLTMESEPCLCSDNQSGRECTHHSHSSACRINVHADSFISNAMTCSYNSFYRQINTACVCLVRFQKEDEEELMEERILNLESIPVLIYSPTRQSQNDSEENGENSHIDLDICMTDLTCDNVTQFDCISLNIEGLYSQDLDIKDYNLEYYMFSNPDIIIEANSAYPYKTNTLIFDTPDHCPRNADAKTTPNSCKISSRISEDDDAFDFYCNSDSLLIYNEMDNLILQKANATGLSPINLSDGHAFLSNFGGLEK